MPNYNVRQSILFKKSANLALRGGGDGGDVRRVQVSIVRGKQTLPTMVAKWPLRPPQHPCATKSNRVGHDHGGERNDDGT